MAIFNSYVKLPEGIYSCQDSRMRSSLRRLERALDARVVQRYVPHAVRRTSSGGFSSHVGHKNDNHTLFIIDKVILGISWNILTFLSY